MRSLKVALVVGTILALINHLDSVVSGSMDTTAIFQILLTYAVPYSVSTFGSAMQAVHMDLDDHMRGQASARALEDSAGPTPAKATAAQLYTGGQHS